jgi:hypothetical protein
MSSIPPFAAAVTNGGNGPFVTVMAGGSGLIAAPGTLRHKGREAEIRCEKEECQLSEKVDIP